MVSPELPNVSLSVWESGAVSRDRRLRSLVWCMSTDSMPPGLDDNKRSLQFLLVVQGQDPLDFSVHSILVRGQNA